MPPRPSLSSIGYNSKSFRKITAVTGVILTTTTCDMPPNQVFNPHDTIIEGNRAKISSYLGYERKITPLSQLEFKRALTEKDKKSINEITALHNYGGYLFSAHRIPNMTAECPTITERDFRTWPTKVYMRFPDNIDNKKPRIIVFLHGGGEQDMKGNSTTNAIRFTKALQEEGDPVILIAPQDGWGNYYPEGREKDQPGNWRDYNDPDTFANLIEFAERIIQKPASNITLASFSSGNIGIMKILRSLEATKENNPEAASLYERIKHIAYFDSVTGEGRDYVARWMNANPGTTVASCYNHKYEGYEYGNKIMTEAIQKFGIDAKRIHTEKMPFNYGHGVYEDIFMRFTVQ